MAGFGPQSIRGKVTLAATVATALAMLFILGITAFAMNQILTGMISTSLDDRLDRAQAEVAAGNYQAAIDLAGEEMMQIIDANGNVIAETPNARGLAAIAFDDDDDDEKRFDKLEFERDDDDDDDDISSRSNVSGAISGNANKPSSNVAENEASTGGSTSGSGSANSGTSTRPSAQPSNNAYSDDDDDAAEEARERAEEEAEAARERAEEEAEEARERVEEAEEEARRKAEEEAEEARERAEEEAEAARERAEEEAEAARERAEEEAERKEEATRKSVAESEDAEDDDDDADDDDVAKKASKHIGFTFVNRLLLSAAVSASAEVSASAATSAAASATGAATSSTAPTSSAAATSSTAPTGSTAATSSTAPTGSTVATSSTAPTGSTVATNSGALSAQQSPSVNQAAYLDATEVFGDEGPYLVKKRQVRSPDGAVTLAAITSLASAARTARLATQLLGTIFLALLCLVVAFTWNMAARTLQPVEHMRRTAESITASNLGERIPVPERDKDLSRLAVTFNELLERVEASFNEQRRFVSDASHELKSPVAATGIMLETLRDHPETVDTNQVITDLTMENNRLANIVGDLLTLARSDEGRMQVDAKPIDLMDLLLEEAAGLETRKGVSVDTSGVQPVVFNADAELLSHSVRNLLENAARYAKTTVKLSCAQDNDHVYIAVSDDGCGIAPEDRERVFDRFVSLEDGRSNPDSTGLGLPVARSIVERHGGTLVFTDPELGGATALITVPTA